MIMIRKQIWCKLLYNLAVSPMSTLTDLSLRSELARVIINMFTVTTGRCLRPRGRGRWPTSWCPRDSRWPRLRGSAFPRRRRTTSSRRSGSLFKLRTG